MLHAMCNASPQQFVLSSLSPRKTTDYHGRATNSLKEYQHIIYIHSWREGCFSHRSLCIHHTWYPKCSEKLCAEQELVGQLPPQHQGEDPPISGEIKIWVCAVHAGTHTCTPYMLVHVFREETCTYYIMSVHPRISFTCIRTRACLATTLKALHREHTYNFNTG